ncbi:hypothetical protein VCHA50P415_90085 [Vibrio chagasii]|nr:hypothetical protein VCHA34P117_110081 [Vibrio chagasii]CAH6804551.1 hypothetical protein VCHA34P121_110083 [Vibrio chagasii]CAH6812132.1 hypothetical protein VCHA37O173_120082 [Vibrio chagasii]CAH6818083.1 hypothetical protein VCHA29O39_130081 [Vibrio chagasii]CAH6836381.1 hypothetical protein VCHA35P150_180019 [Vibrio chagasii]
MTAANNKPHPNRIPEPRNEVYRISSTKTDSLPRSSVAIGNDDNEQLTSTDPSFQNRGTTELGISCQFIVEVTSTWIPLIDQIIFPSSIPPL